jgi:hypothetical protein
VAFAFHTIIDQPMQNRIKGWLKPAAPVARRLSGTPIQDAQTP